MATTKPTGYVVYEGASLLDGMPIVAIATLKSRNGKTSNMMQVWVMRSDIDPLTANRTGADYSICGNCKHRGTPTTRAKGTAAARTCYVQIGQAPASVYRTYRNGRYPTLRGHAALAALGRGRKIRVGAYGDGAALPSYIVDSLVSEATLHTAYSHQAALPGATFDHGRYMQSVDTLAEAQAAWDTGARTFRVISDLSELVPNREISCPSLIGKHCADCGLCDGTARHPKAKSIAIPVHGAGSKHFAAAA